MKTLKGPAIFLAQFAGDEAPFNSLPAIARWAQECGFKGVQIPSWDARLFDLKRAAESDTYCDEVRGTLADAGIQLTELSIIPVTARSFDDFASGGTDDAANRRMLGL